jgi:hypothetical protein
LALTALLVLAPLGAAAEEPGFGLQYCAPTVVPKCVDADATFANPARTAACKRDLIRYVKSVLAFRECLIRQSEAAVAEANATVERFNCSSAAGKRCP